MAEHAVRALLAELAAEPAPPPRVDIAAARHHGRRRLRWRRAGLAAAPLAAAAAAALIVTGTIGFGPGPRGGNPNVPVAPRPAATAALTPHASFGWLPAGFSQRKPPRLALLGSGNAWLVDPFVAGLVDAWTPGQVTVNAWSPTTGRVLALQVIALRNCHLGPSRLPTARGYFQLDCTGGGRGQITAPAPPVRGRRAYWTVNGGLLWQAQPGAWAQLSPWVQWPGSGLPRAVVARRLHRSLAGWQSTTHFMGWPDTVQSAATRALLRTVAAHVSYGTGTAVLFPFRLTGLPADWRAHVAMLTAAGGRLLDTSLMLGPASNHGALTISVTPAAGTRRSACGTFISGQPEHVSIGGAQGFLRTIDQPGRREQDLCLASYHGWSLKLYLRLNASGSSRRLPGAPSGALAALHHLRLLGPDPAGWTAAPLG
ncbi:MAG: hypothetical protein ACM32E_24475 [Gemmatimonadota bacterium]